MIPHSRPTLGDEEVRLVQRALVDAYVGPGPATEEFERAFAALHGSPHAIAVSSGTIALELVLRAVGAGPGGLVVIPAYVCAAVAHAVWNTGAQPVAVDINPRTLGLCPVACHELFQHLHRAGHRVDAVVAVHPFGQGLDLEPFATLGVPIVEDCAASLGCHIHGRLVGSATDVSVFSFASVKMITTGAGGMVLTSSAAIRDDIRGALAYDQPARPSPGFRTNARMSSLNAVLGLAQLARLPEFIAARRVIAERYVSVVSSAYARQEAPADTVPSWHRFIAIDDRAEVMAAQLLDRGVMASTTPASWFDRDAGWAGVAYPGADAVRHRLISLPIYPSLGARTEEVVSAFEDVLAGATTGSA